MTDMQMLQEALRGIEAKIAAETDQETLRWLDRVKTFVCACMQVVQALGEGELAMSFGTLADINRLSYRVRELAKQDPHAAQALRAYMMGIPTYSEDAVHQDEMTMEHHGYVMMKLYHVMPFPRTFVEKLTSDLKRVNHHLAKNQGPSIDVWFHRTKTLIEGCLQAAAVMAPQDLPPGTDEIGKLSELERFAAAVRNKDPEAAQALWRYLRNLPGYDESKFGAQEAWTEEKHGFVHMGLPSLTSWLSSWVPPAAQTAPATPTPLGNQPCLAAPTA